MVGPTNRKLDEFDVFIRDERAAGILKKVLKKGEPSFESMLTGDTPFGLATNFRSCKYPPAEPGALVESRSKRRFAALRGRNLFAA